MQIRRACISPLFRQLPHPRPFPTPSSPPQVLLSIASLDVLLDAVHVLRDEVLGELASPSRGTALAPFARAVGVLLGDVQVRGAGLRWSGGSAAPWA